MKFGTDEKKSLEEDVGYFFYTKNRKSRLKAIFIFINATNAQTNRNHNILNAICNFNFKLLPLPKYF